MNNVSKRLAFLIISSSPSPRNIATTFRATRSSQSPYFAWVMVFSYEGHTGYTSRMYFPGIQGWDFFTVGAAGCKARQDNQPFQQLQQWKIPALYSRKIQPTGIFHCWSRWYNRCSPGINLRRVYKYLGEGGSGGPDRPVLPPHPAASSTNNRTPLHKSPDRREVRH